MKLSDPLRTFGRIQMVEVGPLSHRSSDKIVQYEFIYLLCNYAKNVTGQIYNKLRIIKKETTIIGNKKYINN